MPVCAQCGQDNPDVAKFCLACGSPLEAAEPPAPAEERKLITAIFVDLVGSTARSEQLDPEDVKSLVAPYHARVRAELERHGGTFEKFSGDAVLALFGSPKAHEDDPERAIRAGLAVRNAIAELNAGDVLNTAARIQSAAPKDGILVGQATYLATKNAFDFNEMEPVQAKGKSEA